MTQAATTDVVDQLARRLRLPLLAGDEAGDASPETTYRHDPDTIRLVRLAVARPSDDEVLPDLRWVNDAVGNVTFQEDLSADVVWFDNPTVQPHREHVDDARHRPIEATGHTHALTCSGTAGVKRHWYRPCGLGLQAHAADGGDPRGYTQRDTFDAQGNLTAMSHRSALAWDAFDRLANVHTTSRYPYAGADDEDDADDHALVTRVEHDRFYVYDSSGRRVGKVRAAPSSGALRREERLQRRVCADRRSNHTCHEC